MSSATGSAAIVSGTSAVVIRGAGALASALAAPIAPSVVEASAGEVGFVDVPTFVVVEGVVVIPFIPAMFPLLAVQT